MNRRMKTRKGKILMNDVLFGGGNSSVQIARTSKGEYTWEEKLYFLGNDMRSIKKVLVNLLKSRAILEHCLGQEVIPTEEMAAHLKSLQAQVDKAVMLRSVGMAKEQSGE